MINIKKLKRYAELKERYEFINSRISSASSINYESSFSDKTFISKSKIEKYILEKERIEEEMNDIEDELDEIKNMKDRTILELKYFENRTNDEIAYQLNCSVATVKRRIKRILNELEN